jgi:RNA-directed DNA polymerase
VTTRPADVASALAAAFLAEGDWDADALRARAAIAIGTRAFVAPVIEEVLAAYRTAPRAWPRELARAIAAGPAFESAVARAHSRRRPMPRVRVWLPVARPELDLVSRALPVLRDSRELAEWLGLTDGELDWFADPRSWERRRSADPRLRHYGYRWRATRSGERLLERPRPRLRALQRRVLHELLALVPTHPAAHGFVPGRSVHSFAAPHAGRSVVVRVDLRSFFSSVGAGRVWSVLLLAGYPEQVAHLLTALGTNAVPPGVLRGHGRPEQRRQLSRPHLPQGAPTSPALANLVSGRLDRRLAGLAAARGFRYTRYADDLAFSTDGGGADALLGAVGRIVVEEGFEVHPDKVSVQRSGQRQRLAGLVVNERPRVARAEVDRLRAVLHDAAVHGPAAANREGVEDFRQHLQGRVAWASYRDPARGRRLAAQLDAITWT